MAGPRDARLARLLARVLWIGVLVSSLSLAIGLVLALLTDRRISAPWLTTGLLTLMATPVARVFASAIEYLRQRDWLFATLTMLVLLELGASIVAALVFHQRL